MHRLCSLEDGRSSCTCWRSWGESSPDLCPDKCQHWGLHMFRTRSCHQTRSYYQLCLLFYFDLGAFKQGCLKGSYFLKWMPVPSVLPPHISHPSSYSLIQEYYKALLPFQKLDCVNFSSPDKKRTEDSTSQTETEPCLSHARPSHFILDMEFSGHPCMTGNSTQCLGVG